MNTITVPHGQRQMPTFSKVPIDSGLSFDQIHQLRLAGDARVAVGSEITVSGWIRSIRGQKDVCFIQLHDGTNMPGMQIMFDIPNSGEALVLKGKELTVGTAISVRGILQRNDRKSAESSEAVELWGTSITVHGLCDVGVPAEKAPSKKANAVKTAQNPDTLTVAEPKSPVAGHELKPYPLQKKYQSLEFLRDLPSLKLRTNTYSAIFRVRSRAAAALHDFFQKDGFFTVHAPVLTPLDCEGAGEMFSVATPRAKDPFNSFFESPAYLSVSGQLYAEIAAASVRKVYSFGPTFRAENSHTTRHLAEFWMLEPEIAFADLSDVCDACEKSIQYTVKELLEKSREDLEFLQSRYDNNLIPKLEAVATTPFARITYTEAINVLKKAIANEGIEFKYPVQWGESLQSEHERYLAEKVYCGPVFVTNYPASMKPFYMRIDGDAPENVSDNSKSMEYSGLTPVPETAEGPTVACMDLLVPGIGELCGGSQREDRFPILATRVNEAKLSGKDYGWYLDLRRFGTVPHGGWGMGFERFVAYVTGMENVRDTVLAPRAPSLMQI